MTFFTIEKTHTHTIIHIFGIKFSFKKQIDYKLELEKAKKEIKEFIEYKIITTNIIKEQHFKTFPKYKNIYTGKTIVILATGPSMKYYSPIKDAIHIGINKACLRNDINLDYLFSQDERSINKCMDEFLNNSAQKFLGYFLKAPGTPSYLKYVDRNDVNLYYMDTFEADYSPCFMPLIEYHGLAKWGSSVFSAVQFALYTNPSKIYLVGCDCTNLGYFNGKAQTLHLPEDIFVNGWKSFSTYQQAHYPNTEIISINPENLKGLFKDIYTEAYLKENDLSNVAKVNNLEILQV